MDSVDYLNLSIDLGKYLKENYLFLKFASIFARKLCFPLFLVNKISLVLLGKAFGEMIKTFGSSFYTIDTHTRQNNQSVDLLIPLWTIFCHIPTGNITTCVTGDI